MRKSASRYRQRLLNKLSRSNILGSTVDLLTELRINGGPKFVQLRRHERC